MESYALSRLRVLIVEDDGFTQQLLRAIVKRLGARAEVCADGPSALAAVSSGTFDVMLVDWQMPGMDGCALTRTIRRLPEPAQAKMPIIMVTGTSDQPRVLAARDAGVDGYLVKPVSPKKLHDHLLAVMRRRSLSQTA